jgi:hypothetical protein
MHAFQPAPREEAVDRTPNFTFPRIARFVKNSRIASDLRQKNGLASRSGQAAP